MKITLNGGEFEIAGAVGLPAFLENLGLGGKRVVVEIDEQAVFPRDYETTEVREGARIEVVTLAAGG